MKEKIYWSDVEKNLILWHGLFWPYLVQFFKISLFLTFQREVWFPPFGYPPIKTFSPYHPFSTKSKHARSIKLYILEMPLSKCLQVQKNLEVDPLSNRGARSFTVLASMVMQNIKEIHCSIFEINENTLKFGYSIPGSSFLKSNTQSRCSTVFASIIMQKIKKFMVEFPKKIWKPVFWHLIPC